MNKDRKIIVKFKTESDYEKFFKTNNIDKWKLNILSATVKKENDKIKFCNLTFENVDKIKKTKPRNLVWKKHWDLYDFNNDCNVHYKSIEFVISHTMSKTDINSVFLQDIQSEHSKYIHFPKYEKHVDYLKRFISPSTPKNKYPIYVISKGRANNCITADALISMGVDFKIVIEKQEWELYKKNYDESYLLELGMRFKDEYDTYIDDFDETKSKGSGPARNFVWNHAKESGAKFHWIIDDNIGCFFIFQDNYRVKCCDGSIFTAAENFVDRYHNIGIAGMNYRAFVIPGSKDVPYVANTKIYSCLLIKNSLPIRWECRYNEDVDLCIRAMKLGYCTIQFDAFLTDKATTQTCAGGNTEAFYSEEGTLPKSKMLEVKHPDITIVKWKYARWHHFVDYSVFKYYRNRTIEQTLIDISEPRILKKDSPILNEIKELNLRSDLDYDNILLGINPLLKEKILGVVKKWKFLNNNDFIVRKLTENPIIKISDFLFLDDSVGDERIVSVLLNLDTDSIEAKTDLDNVLDFVDVKKRKKIIKELIRNKYIFKTKYKKVDFELKELYLTKDEHERKLDSKDYVYKKYFDIEVEEIPYTLTMKIANGIEKREKKTFVSRLTKSGETKIENKTGKVLAVVGDELFDDKERLSEEISNFISEKDIDIITNSGINNIDFLTSMFALNNGINSNEFIPNLNYNKDFAIVSNIESMLNESDYMLFFVDKNVDGNKYVNYLDKIGKHDKLKVIHYGKNNIDINNVM